MNKIFFISDMFHQDDIVRNNGGAEKCNHTLLFELFHEKYNNFQDYMLVTMTCPKLSPKIINKNINSTFFISNFMTLSEENKNTLIEKNVDYIIIEHDHKYLKSNNPSLYSNYLSGEEGLQNMDFFKNARAVLCQSSFATDILYKNLQLENLINLKGNLWSEGEINLLHDTLKASKDPEDRDVKWGILKTANPNKGIPETIEYCIEQEIPYTFIGHSLFPQFTQQVSRCEGIVFFPRWVETFNRFLVEARALNCKIMTNKRVGCVHDGWMQYKGEAMIEKMRSSKKEIFELYEKLIKKEKIEHYKYTMPRVTIITTFVKAEEFVEEYLNTMTEQTIFDDIDLLIYDAGSTGKEAEIISKYTEKYSNIRHIRDENKISSSEAFNKMIELSDNEYIGMVMIDDRPAPYYAETLRKYLHFSNTDLVYGDCVQTYQSNAKIDESFSTSKNLYEHSLKEFTKENMIKSLPGPMPMFKKSMIERSGGFNSEFKHANDWELWLRCVRDGSEFLRVNSRVGLYYFNPDGVTTSADKFTSKIKEEATLFTEYKDVIGEDNYNKYKQYFSQGLKK